MNEKENLLHIFFDNLLEQFLEQFYLYCKDITEIPYTSHPVSPIIISYIRLHIFKEKKEET